MLYPVVPGPDMTVLGVELYGLVVLKFKVVITKYVVQALEIIIYIVMSIEWRSFLYTSCVCFPAKCKVHVESNRLLLT